MTNIYYRHISMFKLLQTVMSGVNFTDIGTDKEVRWKLMYKNNKAVLIYSLEVK